MKRRFVIDRDFFAGLDVAPGDEENVIVEDLHERGGRACVIDVVSAVAAAAAVETPATIHFTDPQHLAMRAPPSFGVCDLLARVLRDLVPALEWNRGKAAFAVNR
jgi:hypothetical protein